MWLHGCTTCLEADLPSFLPRIVVGLAPAVCDQYRPQRVKKFILSFGGLQSYSPAGHSRGVQHFLSTWVDCCIHCFHLLFNAEQTAPDLRGSSNLRVFHVYRTSLCGLAAALLLCLYDLRSRMELKVWFPTGTRCCCRKEKGRRSNRTVVLQVSVSEGA